MEHILPPRLAILLLPNAIFVLRHYSFMLVLRVFRRIILCLVCCPQYVTVCTLGRSLSTLLALSNIVRTVFPLVELLKSETIVLNINHESQTTLTTIQRVFQ
jgi:hypothetical protein